MTITQTKRLTLQQANLQDAPFIFELLNSPTWLQYIGDRGIHNLDDAENYIQTSLIDSYNKNGFGLFKMVLLETNQAIGLCGLINRSSLEHIDIGFAILPAFAGKGYTYEAAKAVMDYGQTTLGLTTIVAITTEDNRNSRNLLEKIGLKQIGTIKLEGENEELLLFSN